MNTYEERRTKFFADKLELHKKILKVVDKLCCCDEKTKNELHSEQKEIIQYISEAQQAFKENRELKKLLGLESDRNYICTSFQKTKVTGKMLKVQKIKTKMYTEEENNVQM